MKRSAEELNDIVKRFKTAELSLTELNPLFLDNFLLILKNLASTKWVETVSVFKGFLPDYMLDYDEGPHSLMAFDVGKRFPINDTTLTIREAREIMIQEIITSTNKNAKQARRYLFPTSGKAMRDRQKYAYLEQANALMTHAETTFDSNIIDQLEGDPAYVQIRTSRDLLGWILFLRGKALNNTSSIELSREALTRALIDLKMPKKMESYVTFKKQFHEFASQLKSITPNFDGKHYSNIFLANLNKTIFPNYQTDQIRTSTLSDLNDVIATADR